MTFRLLVFRLLQRIFGEERVHLTTDADRAMAKWRAQARRRRQSRTPQTLDEALEQLRDYCVPYFSDDFPGIEIPKEFWTIENDALFYQVLGFMPLHVPRELLRGPDVPMGFKLAWPIFWLEDDYHFNGWTAISNAGEEILRNAIDAYRSIGMESEAAALEAALRAYVQDPENEESWAGAYTAVPNPYEEADNKNEALRAYFSRNRHLFAHR